MNTFTKNLLLTLSLGLAPLALCASESSEMSPEAQRWLTRSVKKTDPSLKKKAQALQKFDELDPAQRAYFISLAEAIADIEKVRNAAQARIKQEREALQAQQTPSTPTNKQPKTAHNTSPVKRKKEERE